MACEPRTCPACGKPFTSSRPDFAYCSRECRRAAAYEAALSLADLERTGRVWGSGSERRARCPYCGDAPHSSDPGKLLRVNVTTGAWICSSCSAAGLLREKWTPPADSAADPLRPKRGRRRRGGGDVRPQNRAPVAPPAPSPAELAEAEHKRERLRRLWAPCVPVEAPEAEPGAAYLLSRGIPRDVAAGARVRYACDWYGRPAVVCPVQDAAGRLVAADARYTDGGTDPKGRSAGPKSSGLFVATPGALDVAGLTICEGPITALSMAACGFPAVALGGQNAPPWLARRLALRDVLIAFDEGEQATEEKAAKLAAALAAVGSRPYRLRLPAGEDVNDYLQRVGRETARATLTDVICRALVSA